MTARMKTPWHLWVVGLLTLLWNAFGAVDYVMTQTGNTAYLAQLPQEQIDYFLSFPTWYVANWAISIWTSVLGSVLLLLRLKLSVWAFLVSVAGFVISWIYTGFFNPMPGTAPEHILFTVVIFVIMIFSLWYCFTMMKKGVLR